MVSKVLEEHAEFILSRIHGVTTQKTEFYFNTSKNTKSQNVIKYHTYFILGASWVQTYPTECTLSKSFLGCP
jgi:hypothetical protein